MHLQMIIHKPTEELHRVDIDEFRDAFLNVNLMGLEGTAEHAAEYLHTVRVVAQNLLHGLNACSQVWRLWSRCVSASMAE